ncbi:MAG TPA: nicotinate-nucleotide--dimethylbenzimidazole phosphoribosyltransferase [Pyrinomonadaceae bacterium]|nr:nicotinate-nucleotide--dimethylbenzimidazole phosphoribosyltransferase [Pyrinomonadaceae bacterium]
MSSSNEQLNAQIEAVDHLWIAKAAARQLTLTKPPHSLGHLEEIANRLAAIQQTIAPKVNRKRIYVVAADHGVTAEGVSVYPREVTAQMISNFVNGGAAINVLGRHGEIDVKVVDAGVDADLSARANLIDVKRMRGTANFACGPAMSRVEAERLLYAGIDLARAARADGIELLGTGEMGIGNTTAASAITAALTREDPASHTDRGTGVDDRGLGRKIEVIRRSLRINKPDPNDAIDVLSKVGGAEIAVMMGIVIGAAISRIAVIADGFISTAAAALAVSLCPNARGYLFVAHRSVERGHAALIRLIDLKPLLDLKMRLGEGTGAALAMHIIDAAAKLLSEMATFSEAHVSDKA